MPKPKQTSQLPPSAPKPEAEPRYRVMRGQNKVSMPLTYSSASYVAQSLGGTQAGYRLVLVGG